MTLRTIYELMGAILACLAFYVFLIQLSMPNIRGTRWVSLSFLAGAASVELIVLRGAAPLFFTEILSGVLAMLVNVLVYWGFTDLLRLGHRTGWILWLTVPIPLALVAWFTYVHNDVAARILVYNLFTAAQYLLLAVLLFRNGTPETSLPRNCLAAVYLFWTGYRLVGILGLGPHPMAIYQPLTTPVTSILPVARVFTALLTGNGFVWLAMTYPHADLERQSNTDVLTGLLNRRALEKTANREIMLARRKQLPLALLLLDLDHFKSINDVFGHEAGDSVLILTAWCLRENLRNVDFVARLGGEEFVALLPDTSEATAYEIAERLRDRISGLRIPNLAQPLSFTASFGVSTFTALDPTWEEMLRRSDRALYRAKRNCVEIESIA